MATTATPTAKKVQRKAQVRKPRAASAKEKTHASQTLRAGGLFRKALESVKRFGTKSKRFFEKYQRQLSPKKVV